MFQLSIPLSDEIEIRTKYLQLEKIIKDRGSHYSVTAGRVENKEEIKAFLKKLKENKKYLKASHNSFAVRLRKANQLIENKNDDGETGAGMVILRSIRKINAVNVIVVVTRWFGGTKLYNDRFKHLQDCTRIILEICYCFIRQAYEDKKL